MNDETDLGPRVSLLLKSLLLRSLPPVSLRLGNRVYEHTSKAHQQAADSRIAPKGCGAIPPLAPQDVQNKRGFG